MGRQRGDGAQLERCSRRGEEFWELGYREGNLWPVKVWVGMYEGVLDVLGSDEGFSLGSVGEGRGERGGGVKCGGGGERGDSRTLNFQKLVSLRGQVVHTQRYH